MAVRNPSRQIQTVEADEMQYLPVFVYGTLRQGQGNWERLLKGRTETELPAKLLHSKMYSRGIAYVVDAKPIDGECQVIGDLMWVKPDFYQAVMLELDRLEGYRPSNKKESHYTREIRQAQYTDPENGEVKTVRAWVYQAGKYARSGLSETLRVMDGDWLNHRHQY